MKKAFGRSKAPAKGALEAVPHQYVSSLVGSKANGEYLSRQFYHNLIRSDRNVFSMPETLLNHTKQIKGRVHSKSSYKSEYHQKLFSIKTTKNLTTFPEKPSYTDMLRRREEFRKKLVSLIIAKEVPDANEVDAEFPSSKEREIMRYYYYIKHGVDTIHVSPLDLKILNR